MKIIHTADLHLGQILYQNYGREDEHNYFFQQLQAWCQQYSPDALVVSGDIFDIQHPVISVKRMFNDFFVRLHRAVPAMRIVIVAGNHDSAMRLHADNSIWGMGDVVLVGMPPVSNSHELPDGWQNDYIVRLPQGYIIAMPYYFGSRSQAVQSVCSGMSGVGDAIDLIGREEVMNTVHRLNREEGISIVIITHYMSEAATADYLVVMDNGKIHMTGTPREVFADVDNVRGLGLDVPPMTSLAHELRQEGIDLRPDVLTVEEMVEEVCRLSSKN